MEKNSEGKDYITELYIPEPYVKEFGLIVKDFYLMRFLECSQKLNYISTYEEALKIFSEACKSWIDLSEGGKNPKVNYCLSEIIEFAVKDTQNGKIRMQLVKQYLPQEVYSRYIS